MSMDNVLKKKVVEKVKEIYPKISTDDIIVLYGSRAKDYFIEGSDVDIMVFTKNYNYFKEVSIQKGLRKKGEDAGFEINLDNKIYLEVKIQYLKIPKFEVMFYHDILSSKALTSKNKFKIFQNKIKREFMDNYDNLLFNSYISFFNEQKNIEGILRRKDKLSKINLVIKKGIVIQALLRLVLVLDKKPYTCDKNLSHEASKTKDWDTVLKFVNIINSINSYEEAIKSKRTIEKYIDLKMPKEPYVGNWWKFLKKFKES